MYMIQILEYLFCSKIVQTRDTFFNVSFHGVGFARSCLSIRETRNLSTSKRTLYEGLNALIIDLVIRSVLIIWVIEIECCFFDVFGEINFLSVLNELYLY